MGRRRDLPTTEIVEKYLRGVDSVKLAFQYETSTDTILRRIRESGVPIKRKCGWCETEFLVEGNFNQEYCNPECREIAKYKNDNKKCYTSLQNFLRAVKETCGCVDCGITDIRVLHFDHLRDKVKKVNTCGSIRRAVEEMEKCEVVCANCHAIRTWERAGYGD